MQRSTRLLITVSLAAGIAATASAQTEPRRRPPAEEPPQPVRHTAVSRLESTYADQGQLIARRRNGQEHIDARRDDYIRRHGREIVTDPDRMRELARALYESERSRSRHQIDGIAGTNWVSLGPTNFAGRIRSAAVHPSIAGTWYLGAASGGVWKTTNGGVSWSVLTDGLANLSVGSVAVAPSSPNTVYLGTGEPVGLGIPGIGFLASTDGGATWTFPGTDVLASYFWDINVHPTNAQDVLAGTSAGGFRSANGGVNWTPFVLPGSLSAGTPITEIVRDPTNANVLYATHDGSTRGILKSIDGGSTWTDFGTGIPTGVSRISIAIDSSGTTLYAGFDQGFVAKVYKRTSVGASWADTAQVSPSGLYGGQPAYNNSIVVAPGTPDTVIVCGVVCSKSTTGGSSWARLTAAGGSYHVDVHELRYDATGTLVIATDGGIYTSTDHGQNTVARNSGLVTAQFYFIDQDLANIDRIAGGLQDNGTWRRMAGGTTWVDIAGSDGMATIIHAANPEVTIASNQPISRGTFLWRSKLGSATSSWPLAISISPIFPAAEKLPFRTNVVADPVNPSTLYLAASRVWKSTSGGDTWWPLPATTTDGSTWDMDRAVEPIAVAASNRSVIMVGKWEDVFRSEDGGQTWRRAARPWPSWVDVNHVEIDPTNPYIVYVALGTTSGSSVYRSTDGGVNWTVRSNGLPNFAAHVIRVDPTDIQTIYAGTSVGVYRSTDSGASWSLFGTGMPKAPIYDLRISPDGMLMRAGSHGRGVWELQTVSPNAPPTAVIHTPSSTTVALGTTVTFTGTVSDGGGPVTGSWHFPDTWERAPVSAAGSTTTAHKFTAPGRWPVTLTAIDSEGARAAATVTITVDQPGDECAGAIAFPTGTFPTTVTVNTENFVGWPWPYDPDLCVSGGAEWDPAYSAWLTFTAPSSATYEFSTCGSSANTLFGAFSGSCGSLTRVACNDDADALGTAGCPNGGSRFTLAMTAGQTIYLLAGGKYYFQGAGLLSVTVAPASSSAPRVTRIATIAGPSTGGTPVTLQGENFAAGAALSIGGAAATSVVVHTPHALTAITGAGTPGARDVVVTNPDMQSGRLAGGFTYIDCSIDVSPAGVTVGQAGDTGAFGVVASPGCGWSAVPSAGWITTGSSGVGNGTVAFTVAPNPFVTSRSGTITVGSRTFNITQQGIVPTNLVASVASTTSITLTWNAGGGQQFQVWRKSGVDPFEQIATPTASPFLDSGRPQNSTSVYRVRAVDGTTAVSAFTNDDAATTLYFADDPVVPGTTPVRAIHVVELRIAANAIRHAAGLTPVDFPAASLVGSVVQASHFLEIRDAIEAARQTLLLQALSYTPIASGTVIQGVHVTELRNAVK